MFENKKVILVVTEDSYSAEFAVKITQQGAEKILLVGDNQAILDEVCTRVNEAGGQALTKQCSPTDLDSIVILSKKMQEVTLYDYLINGTEYEFMNMLPAKTKLRVYRKGSYSIMWTTDSQT